MADAPPARRRPRLAAFAVALALLAAGVVLGGLLARVDDGGAGAATAPAGPTPSASPGSRTTEVVWAIGDGADGGPLARELAERAIEDRPDRFLYLGDVYEEGTAEEFDDNYESVYGPLDEVASPTPGNHEWGRRAEGYDPYWKEVLGRPLSPWYEFEVGRWQVISLNSEAPHGAESEQVRWLREELAGARGTCRLAFYHRPLMSAGEQHGDQPDVQPLWDELKGRVALVLNSHDHTLQRFRPRDGIVQVVSGAGGHDLHPLDEEDPRLAFGAEGVVGGVRVELHPDHADVAFVTANGRALDRSRVDCRAG